jgi:dTDP-4-dehydrorhamnose 3,5-epimerase-like enzyme
LSEVGIAVDDRGQLSYFNSLPFEKVVRFYIVENFSTSTIRAFHGHKIEEKYLLVVSGSAIVVIAKLDEDELSSPKRHVLSARNPQLLFIPKRHANGFRALEPSTKLIFFSTSTVEQSQIDDHRFPYDYFGKELWEVQSR